MIETLKDKIVAAIKGTGNIVQATVDTVTQILATTIKDAGKLGTSVTDNGVKVVLKEPETAVSNN